MSRHTPPGSFDDEVFARRMMNEAKALWLRIKTERVKKDSDRLAALSYRAWRRYQRRVDALLDAHGVGYVDLPPIFGWRSWRTPEI